ncbi:tail fiber protein [Escherichia coli]
MGNLNETEKWEENIYQLETSDPVLGGADGISNRAPRQLANRTKWLKKKTEEAAQSLAEHVRSRNHPDATLTAKGFTQLSSATNSTSETLAATPKAVKAAYDLAAGKAPVSHTHPWSQITGVPAASLTAKGTVQLSSATDSQSETEAATPKAVKIAYDLARGKYTAQDATTTRKGIVQLSSATNSTSETLAATPKAVKAAYDLAAGKAPVSHTHPWSQITGVPAASLTAKGTVQLSSATDSQSETEAATPKAVKAAYDLANGKQPADATLTALAGLATAADRLPYFTGADRAALATLTAIGRAIIAKGSIKDVLNYLGLGEAAKRNVGNGQNQIPDMAAFASSLSSTGFQKLPSGLIIQWGIVSGASNYTVTYPVTFPNRSLALLAVPHTTPVAGISAMGIANCSDISKSQFYIIVGGISHGEIVKYERSCFWVAIGV